MATTSNLHGQSSPDPVGHEVVLGCRHEACLLVRVHADQTAAEGAIPATSDLNEDEGVRITHDQIDLTRACTGSSG